MRFELTEERKAAVVILAAIVFATAVAFAWQAYQKTLPHKETFAKSYGLTLQTYDGKKVQLSDYRGKVVIAYAWASWCPYCGGEIQNLATLKAKYGDRIVILAINRAEPLADAKGYTDQLSNVSGVTFLLDPTDSFFKSVSGYAMPETIFIQKNGDVMFHQHGPMTLDTAEQKLQQLLSP